MIKKILSFLFKSRLTQSFVSPVRRHLLLNALLYWICIFLFILAVLLNHFHPLQIFLICFAFTFVFTLFKSGNESIIRKQFNCQEKNSINKN